LSLGRIVVVLALLGLAAGVWAYGTARRAERATPDPAMPPAARERVRVEVLNAGGVSGRAREATEHLRDVGFDVVQFGNARSFDRDSSVVIDRVDRPDLAQAVANVLGIGNVLTEPDPNLFVDVSVLLGRSWSGPVGAASPSSERSTRAPWDPRGWLGR
jgi:hypothetical protein